MSILSVFAETEKVKAHIDDPEGRQRLKVRLIECFQKAGRRPFLILCIGTDRSTGDALGPLIGTQLARAGLPRLHVWGTLDEPVHATNLAEKIASIRDSLLNPYIVAIDASLGRLDSVGCVTLADGPLRPGAGVHKDLPAVGDVNITGIVNVGGFMEYMVLQNTRLNLVWHMSERISELIADAYLQTEVCAPAEAEAFRERR
ncbi:putative sporulation protein YyaC [Acididesulfobacillus acetoxydans]|uniref:Sporulation protein YyaC n=1 Tax=Acididesulfobacillus acetoxydans TaxID=1561005 RepID=A0A8S0X360_9FIRM|nr:spore protease YyaC [Acididesulfobacillus acetoxydans]CAA7599810.1 putative sporulation protein YyaC [Acididesulfobacillus acetoxydans]CEJ07376.1 Sporulation protein YyaC [Acididesulfobacillus acetoxydans]